MDKQSCLAPNAYMAECKDDIEAVWLYSRYCGDMLFAAQRLYAVNEGYAACVLLFNAIELLFKSLRQSDTGTFNEDVVDLHKRNILSDDHLDFVQNKDSGIRVIRNIMMHKDAYQYCFEVADVALPFYEPSTWISLYEDIAPKVYKMLSSAVHKNYKLSENL